MNEPTQHEQCVGFCYQSAYCNRYTVTVKHICRLTLTTQLLLRLFPPLEEDSFCILPVTCSPRRLPKFGPCGASTFCIHSFHEPLHFIQIGLNSSRFVFSLGIYYSTSDFQCYLQWACYHLGLGSSLLFSSLHRRFSISLFRMCTLLIVCASKWNENKSEWSTHVKYFWSDLCVLVCWCVRWSFRRVVRRASRFVFACAADCKKPFRNITMARHTELSNRRTKSNQIQIGWRSKELQSCKMPK